MKPRSLLAVTGLMIAACQPHEEVLLPTNESTQPAAAGWVSLFAGGDLANFVKIGDADWRLVDNYVEANDGAHSFLVSQQRYRDFELHVEFWPSPDANSGVFLRCQDATVLGNESCYELNIFDRHSNPDNATGSIINLAPPRVAINAADQWNTYDISMRGSRILVRLNDVVVVDFEDGSFAEGAIGLQSNGGLIRFRNVQVRPLLAAENIQNQLPGEQQ